VTNPASLPTLPPPTPPAILRCDEPSSAFKGQGDIIRGDLICWRVPIAFLSWVASQGVRVWGRSTRSFLPFSLTPLSQRAMSTASLQSSQHLDAPEVHAASIDASASGASADGAPAPAVVDPAVAQGEPHGSEEKLAADGTRMSKIKVALVLGYNGSRFGGLQRNPGQLTIEDVLEEAVCVDPFFLHRFSLSSPPGTKPEASQIATTTISTRSAGQEQPGPIKAFTPLAMLFRLKCSHRASSSLTDQRCVLWLLHAFTRFCLLLR
jgi:hypothetical protein